MSDSNRISVSKLAKDSHEWISIALFFGGLYVIGRAIHLQFGDIALHGYQGFVMFAFGLNGVRNS